MLRITPVSFCRCVTKIEDHNIGHHPQINFVLLRQPAIMSSRHLVDESTPLQIFIGPSYSLPWTQPRASVAIWRKATSIDMNSTKIGWKHSPHVIHHFWLHDDIQAGYVHCERLAMYSNSMSIAKILCSKTNEPKIMHLLLLMSIALKIPALHSSRSKLLTTQSVILIFEPFSRCKC